MTRNGHKLAKRKSSLLFNIQILIEASKMAAYGQNAIYRTDLASSRSKTSQIIRSKIDLCKLQNWLLVRSTTGKTSILSAGILEVVFTEFVGTVISVVLAVVSETEVGLGVVLELVELRGSSPARGIVVVEAVVVQVIIFQKLSFFHQGTHNIRY